ARALCDRRRPDHCRRQADRLGHRPGPPALGDISQRARTALGRAIEQAPIDPLTRFDSSMKYSKVYIDTIGYEIAPVVVSSLELERRLKNVYTALHLGEGQLEALTGIAERRWWEEGHRLSDGAIAAARRALESSAVRPDQLDAVIYGAV